MADVQRAFEQAHGTHEIDLDDFNGKVSDALSGKRADAGNEPTPKNKSESPDVSDANSPAESTQAQELSPEAAQAIQETVASLQETYGDQAPRVIARAQNVAAYLQHDNPMWTRFVETALREGVSQTTLVKICNEVGMEFGFKDER